MAARSNICAASSSLWKLPRYKYLQAVHSMRCVGLLFSKFANGSKAAAVFAGADVLLALMLRPISADEHCWSHSVAWSALYALLFVEQRARSSERVRIQLCDSRNWTANSSLLLLFTRPAHATAEEVHAAMLALTCHHC